jgi:phytoene dehydrogenase-like protein
LKTGAHYDVVIIGAGLSGLAAGIRLAHFGKRVCIFERHSAPGGLNSFYSIGGRKFDVGLHAVTNYVRPGVKGTPLGRILRQLRLDRDELGLCEQRQSRVAFGPRGELSLRFTNDFGVFESEVARLFPGCVDGFQRLVRRLRETIFSPDSPALSARAVVGEHVRDPVLVDMLMCVPLYYGSAQENDMDFGQFAMLFQAVFFEGLARPYEGIRRILRLLVDKYRQAGGERRMNCGVRSIVARNGRVEALVMESGEEVGADTVLSSIGRVETEALSGGGEAGAGSASRSVAGRVTFVETMAIFDREPASLGWGDNTTVFYNDSERLDYSVPEGQVDVRSGVICIPNNFDYGPEKRLPEGIVRVTCLANYDRWARLPEESYTADKKRWFGEIQASAWRFRPEAGVQESFESAVATDMFTPRTVERFTGHRNGAIYGSPTKSLLGTTAFSNLYLCGTDQGLLGIMGSMLSGITMANRHVLSRTAG